MLKSASRQVAHPMRSASLGALSGVTRLSGYFPQKTSQGQREHTRVPRTLTVIGLGYLLVLVGTATFSTVLIANTMPSTTQYNVVPIDGRTWTDWEESYAQNPVAVDLTIEVEHKLEMAMIYNFSTIPIEVVVTNLGNLTLPDFEVWVLIEDQTGHIRGTGGDSPKVSATGELIVRALFIYNVPAVLRGQELRVHVVSMIQRTLVVDKKLLLVRTFPSIEGKELPRILLFFLTFSALPVGVFLPANMKQRAEGWWRRVLEKSPSAAVLSVSLFVIVLVVYWDYVCKVLCYL